MRLMTLITVRQGVVGYGKDNIVIPWLAPPLFRWPLTVWYNHFWVAIKVKVPSTMIMFQFYVKNYFLKIIKEGWLPREKEPLVISSDNTCVCPRIRKEMDKPAQNILTKAFGSNKPIYLKPVQILL